jgi:hypothetical protein
MDITGYYSSPHVQRGGNVRIYKSNWIPYDQSGNGWLSGIGKSLGSGLKTLGKSLLKPTGKILKKLAKVGVSALDTKLQSMVAQQNEAAQEAAAAADIAKQLPSSQDPSAMADSARYRNSGFVAYPDIDGGRRRKRRRKQAGGRKRRYTDCFDEPAYKRRRRR